jgi:hypothetical protein
MMEIHARANLLTSLPVSKRERKRKRLVSHYPFQWHISNDKTHLLKFPLHSNSAKLIKFLICGPYSSGKLHTRIMMKMSSSDIT